MDNSLKNVRSIEIVGLRLTKQALDNSAIKLRKTVDPFEQHYPEATERPLDTARPELVRVSTNVSTLQTNVSKEVDANAQKDIKVNQDNMTNMNDTLAKEAEVADKEKSTITDDDPALELDE
jgi:hypothetical protein